MGFCGGSDGKESACHAEDPGSIPGFGRSLGVENGYPLQYSCLENPMDRGAWRATVHCGCKESDTTDTNTFNKGYSNIFQKCMSHFKMEYRNKRPQKAAVLLFFLHYDSEYRDRDTLLLPLLLPSEVEFKLERVPVYRFSPVQTEGRIGLNPISQ